MKLFIAMFVSLSMTTAMAQMGSVGASGAGTGAVGTSGAGTGAVGTGGATAAGGNVAVPQTSGSMGTDTSTGANRPTNAGGNPNNRPAASDNSAFGNGTGTNPRTGLPQTGAPATTPANQPSTNTNTITP